MNDDVVDYNGQTNAGYGAVLHPYGTMMDPFWKNNHINYISPGHFVTEPQAVQLKEQSVQKKKPSDVFETMDL